MRKMSRDRQRERYGASEEGRGTIAFFKK